MIENKQQGQKVERRDETFAEAIETKIWCETASESNPYIAQKNLVHGYDHLELMAKKSYSEMTFLMLKGELPGKDELALFDATLVALSNLGPRHAATRAVMNASVSKTDITHLLPLALSILSGAHLGAKEVFDSVRFIRKNMNKDPEAVLATLLDAGDQKVHMPGFGARFGDVEIIPEQMAAQLASFVAAGKGLDWCQRLIGIAKEYNVGWFITGVASAAFVDLGFTPKAAAGLFQMAVSPGLLAHGIEMSNKPITAMPFVAEDKYHYMESGHGCD
ncbi:MAG: citrate synthase [Spongiibacteraceae bacterium]